MITFTAQRHATYQHSLLHVPHVHTALQTHTDVHTARPTRTHSPADTHSMYTQHVPHVHTALQTHTDVHTARPTRTHSPADTHSMYQHVSFYVQTRKPRKGAAVIAASMQGFASCRKLKSPVTLTLTLDRVKVTSTYTVYVGLPAYPTM